MSVVIRPERAGDDEDVRAVHLDAFGGAYEADVVERLRASPEYIQELSLVVERDGEIVGHSITSRAAFEGAPLLVLGPIGVMRECQSQGFGSLLMRATIRRATDQAFAAIVLIGHPAYYPRFGFVPASTLGLRTEFNVPDEVAMALRLSEGPLPGGVVRYPPAFSD